MGYCNDSDDELRTWPKTSGIGHYFWSIYSGFLSVVSFLFHCTPPPSIGRQEGLRGCRVMWLQTGWLAGRMPVAALMTLFSSGVQGVGVSGWTLPDGSRGRGPYQQQFVGKRTTEWKEPAPTTNTHWYTFMATELKGENSLVPLPAGLLYLNHDEGWRDDLGIFGLWSVWVLMKVLDVSMRFSSWPKLHQMKF